MRRLLLLLLVVGCLGCMHAGYLVQAAYGQDEIACLARPIDVAIADQGVSPRTRALLRLIPDVKAWGETRGLEPTNSYREYVDLRRDAVVWVVSASHPLRFELETWWFPIVGSVPYLGWFNRGDAERFAARLAGRGLDVDLRTASAYSTLGWFDDPVLSTMVDRGSLPLVNVVLHESVHATHYVSSQSTFNESLADFVADTLTLEYLEERVGFDRWQRLAYEQSLARGEHRIKRFHQTYLELEAIYASENKSDAEKLALKERVTGALRAELGFSRPINNAILAQSRTYHAGTPVFAELFDCLGKNWQRFWEAARRIESDDFDEPQQKDIDEVVRRLLPARCHQGRAR